MGRSGSSRRKHSKKKSLKVSSEGYRKKKSRRNKSKKIRYRDDSFSSYSESSNDESTSSSFSSESEYKTKRSRSCSRNEAKGSKKRNRKRSVSEDGSADSPRLKKRKRSKKSKKIKKRKKSSRKDAYISSANSDSGSRSTCKEEDSGSDELGSHKRSRGRSREKKKDHRHSTKGRSRRSISPPSGYGSESIERETIESKPVRLKSVITVARLEKEEEEEVDMKKDESKEEIVYDYDDYPSSKSNDSVELGVDMKNAGKEVNSGSNLIDSREKESNASSNIGSEVDNLELILRQKALENLSKFRGVKTKPVAPATDESKNDETDVKQLPHMSQPVTHKSKFTWRRDASVTTGKDEKDVTNSGSQPAELELQGADLSSMSRVDNKVNEKLKTVVNTDNVDQKSTSVVETPSSGLIKDGGSKEKQNESSDNSQFEKKTMSVMRGGEMVQVSYKVYIPNKAPALARRKLKR